ncbi:GNAT family N-acetyltransferase [Marinobacterium aestuariivivens]|uniref:GNAT family N-acetyltransferase n=1 Tax=Marinobacterium aestuariivivens TaxID=1698799 RepID=A0ABW1ZY80_9GAMM
MSIQPEQLTVREACRDDIVDLAPLFDQYRQFYGYDGDLTKAERFLRARFEAQDSLLLLARKGPTAVGFVQCYAGYSSLECRPSWLLSDLFVVAEARRQGVARALLQATRQAATRQSCCLVELFTARANLGARRLYEAQGYVEDKEFLHYELML